ncbi:interleukin-15 receptor subunit alpha isoform X4 [Puntigrus tetrazona]|uniref:interleukin-15 receptor subunit alpha isoform X4 n=1 Tax=Puntigrus tetrazona TaxID=1606681 RepID=UPI001C8A8B12|nr:interleukin-15 receptor subunit alpha isoform X4 [Puntigrus tetrazona]
MDMHALVNFIFITAACAHIARASDGCGKPEVGENTVPVTELSHNLGARVRIQCVEGYLRKAGTSNLIRCVMQPNGSAAWHSDLPLKCIRDPRITHATTSDPKIVTTTDPPHVTTRTNAVAALSHGFTPTVSGVTVTVLIILVTAVLICLWLRWRNHRNQNVYNSTPDPSASYIPVSVIGSELSSAQSNRTAENATEGSVVYKNPGTPQEVDACDKLLPQTDT